MSATVDDISISVLSRESSELLKSNHSRKSSPRQIDANLSNVFVIPSMSKRVKTRHCGTKRSRCIAKILVIAFGVMIITVLLSVFLLNLTKKEATTTSSTIIAITNSTTTISVVSTSVVTSTTASATTSTNSITGTTSTSSTTDTTSTSSTTDTTSTSSTTDTTSTSTTTDTTSTSTTTDTTSTSTTTDTTSTSTTTDTTSTSTTTDTTSTSSSTSTTTSTTTTTLLDQSSSLWSFEGNALDSLSSFDGVAVNSPTYKSPGINGFGTALLINGSLGQYIEVATFRNLSYRSFTVQLWFSPTYQSGGDHGFFGQRDTASKQKSLHLLTRGSRLTMGFYSNDLGGVTQSQTKKWYHATFVYDHAAAMKRIYFNGVLDAANSSLPYIGQTGSIVIGKTEQVAGSSNYFYGCIDELLLVMRAKTDSEVLDDATLTTYHSFDTIPTYLDSGPLRLNVTSSDINSTNGSINQGISFITNSSYYQIGGFVILGISNSSFSIALWVNPSSIQGSTLVHLSTNTNGQGSCIDLIGFSALGEIITLIGNASAHQVTGPVILPNTWTHIVSTFSPTNKLRLYVNGTLVGTTTSASYVASGQVNILTLGNALQAISCVSRSIVRNTFLGSIDEFRVYSRELNSADINSLMNP